MKLLKIQNPRNFTSLGSKYTKAKQQLTKPAESKDILYQLEEENRRFGTHMFSTLPILYRKFFTATFGK